MSTISKGCRSQLFPDLPAADWAPQRLGEFAAARQRDIVTDEINLSMQYWRLGMALHLARNQLPHGKWAAFLEAYRIDKTRASKARAIFVTFSDETKLAGITVEEAYEMRERKHVSDQSVELEPELKLSRYLGRLPTTLVELYQEIDLLRLADPAALAGQLQVVKNCLDAMQSEVSEGLNCVENEHFLAHWPGARC